MKEKREKIIPLAELLSYKVRAEELSNDNANDIMRIALQDEERVDALTEILYMDLPEKDTMDKIRQMF
jgi:hypothetical protein